MNVMWMSCDREKSIMWVMWPSCDSHVTLHLHTYPSCTLHSSIRDWFFTYSNSFLTSSGLLLAAVLSITTLKRGFPFPETHRKPPPAIFYKSTAQQVCTQPHITTNIPTHSMSLHYKTLYCMTVVWYKMSHYTQYGISDVTVVTPI